MDILKEWERDPPLATNSVPALWYDFRQRRRDPKSPICRFRDNIPDACAQDITVEIALERAVRSIRPNGKMHNHQSKVSKALPGYEKSLMGRIEFLKHARNFDHLHQMMEDAATPGIGPMTIYDVAVRFGAKIGLEPNRIYIHAGTAAGLKALGVRVDGPSIPMLWLPPLLRRKPADEVEDFLCTYRLAFERLT